MNTFLSSILYSNSSNSDACNIAHLNESSNYLAFSMLMSSEKQLCYNAESQVPVKLGPTPYKRQPHAPTCKSRSRHCNWSLSCM